MAETPGAVFAYRLSSSRPQDHTGSARSLKD